MKKKEQFHIQYIDDNQRELSLQVLFKRVLNNWRLLLVWAAVAFAIGIIIAISIPKTYPVLVKMAPESSSKSSSGLSSLAGIAGINLGSMLSSSDAVAPDIYPDIVTSTPFIIEFFSLPLSFERRGKMISTDYYTYVTEYLKTPWWSTLLGLPKMLMGSVLGFLKGENKKDLSTGIEQIDPKHPTYSQLGVFDHFKKFVVLAIDKKSGLILLSVKEQDPEVSEQVSSAVVDRLQKYVTDYRTEKARKDLEYYQSLTEKAKVEYHSAQQKYADFLDRHQNVVTQRGRVEQDRLKNDVSLTFSLYNSCEQQVQSAQALVQQVTPVFTIIEPPFVPLYGKPSRALVVVVCAFLGGFLAVIWILWGRGAIASLRRKDKEEPVPAPEEDSQA